ncbi:GDP-mannose 4,6-dehydratase [Bacillus sp. Marseille-P3661]|uniref:GDP-mannose 4,6-dehydratase n=1 Tax=Bacillus sp. Marseille-P3661 TaxID=1936234 RepID=UPI000C83E8CF|nr:GDP-mannose 4,6-dehydratase [Bacillus sp. Marseille-P3661]
MNKKMRVFITGSNGFVGRHLINLLSQRGHTVFAGVHENIEKFPSAVKVHHINILDQNRLYELLKEIKPDAIIHLAALSKVPDSWEDPVKTFNINTIGSIHLIQAAQKISPDVKILTVGSSEEYGLTGTIGTPLTEEHPCFPQNPYASSKLSMGQVVLQLAKKNQQTIIHVRPFNHFGPQQPRGFVISDFASQIAQIEKGLSQPFIKVGDLSAIRDFTDVRDVVNAYILLLENNVETGIYNICSGVSRSIKDCLDELIKLASCPVQVIVDKHKFRPLQVPVFLGSYKKINEKVNWKPDISFEQSLQDTLDYWRSHI